MGSLREKKCINKNAYMHIKEGNGGWTRVILYPLTSVGFLSYVSQPSVFGTDVQDLLAGIL